MFHRVRDASKAAVLSLVDLLAADGDDRRLFDVQWATPHLRTLGAVEIARADYLARLERALAAPPALGWGGV
jgi:leucyl/phenylalanyl-tRNA--protein transferase